MLTIFTATKPFTGNAAHNQRNALKSWHALGAEVIAFDCPPEIASECGAICCNEFERNEHGTPYIGSLFMKAQELASFPLMAYVNADMILFSDFAHAIQVAVNRFNAFFMVGQRVDLDVNEDIDFARPTWENELRHLAASKGTLHSECGIDYMAFRKLLNVAWQPLLVGRPCWDVWLLRAVRDLGVPMIDATQSVTAIHCNHGTRQYEAGPNAVPHALDESRHNQAILGHAKHIYITHAKWRLTPGGLVER